MWRWVAPAPAQPCAPAVGQATLWPPLPLGALPLPEAVELQARGQCQVQQGHEPQQPVAGTGLRVLCERMADTELSGTQGGGHSHMIRWREALSGPGARPPLWDEAKACPLAAGWGSSAWQALRWVAAGGGAAGQLRASPPSRSPALSQDGHEPRSLQSLGCRQGVAGRGGTTSPPSLIEKELGSLSSGAQWDGRGAKRGRPATQPRGRNRSSRF